MTFTRFGLAATVAVTSWGVGQAHAKGQFSKQTMSIEGEKAVAEDGGSFEADARFGLSGGADIVVVGDPVEAQLGGGDACVSPPPMPPPGRPVTPAAGGGCFNDQFFVEVQADRAAFAAGYAAELTTRLDLMKPDVLDWVCADNDVICRDLSNPLPLQVESVIDDRAWNVRFDVPVRDDKLCAAVSGIRSASDEARKSVMPGSGTVTPFVGRQCAMRIMTDAQRNADAAMMEWHLNTIGVPPGPGAPLAAEVHVVVVDTGIRPEVGDTIGVRAMLPALDVGGYDPGVRIHPHGTHMALLVNQTAPGAQLYDLRVMSEHGTGAIADLAVALEDIRTSDWFEVGPLVVNLSLGWAPELSRTRDISGPSCTAHEDPAGEAVRYALGALNNRDASHPTVVIAAAGNRPHRAALVDDAYGRHFGVRTDNGSQVDPHTTCPGSPPPSPDWFYPAEWNRRPTCDANGQNPRYLTWAVGATDSREQRGALTIDAPETPVVAPGEHVYVEHPFSDAWPGALCLGDGSPNLLTLPAAVTGSSASAALTSGTVAMVQQVRLGHAKSGLGRAGLQRLTYLTGELIGGFGPARGAWRPDPNAGGSVELTRLSWCRMFYAAEESARLGGDPECVALVACADPNAASPAAVIDGAVETNCRVQADLCLAGALCNPPNPVEPQWDAGYQANTQCLTPEACPLAWSPSAPCEGNAVGCDYERTIEQHSAAPLGPQPGTPTCPDCSFDVTGVGQDDSVLLAEINWQFQSGTTFTFPHLIVDYYDPGWTYRREYVAVPQAAPWEPGDYVKVTDLPDLPLGFGHKVSLWTYVDPPGPGNATSDVSPLRLDQ